MMEYHSPKCWGTMKIVVGVLILLNAFVWPMWLGIDGWVSFFAVLLILGGILKFFHPYCVSTECCPPTKPVMAAATRKPARKRKR